MFEEVQSPDYKICPICKTQMAVGLGGYYKHITPSNRCGYFEKVTDQVFENAVKMQIDKSREQ